MNTSSLWSSFRKRSIFIPVLVFVVLLLVLVALMWGTGQSPVVESVSLETRGADRRLVILGDHFGSERGRSRVLLSGQPIASASYTSWEDEEIVFRLGPEASSGLVYVERGSRRSEGTMVTLPEELPSLALRDRQSVGPLVRTVEPVRAQIGETIAITGRHFGRDRGSSRVEFAWAGPDSRRRISPAPWDYLSWSDREIVVRVPDGAASGPLVVGTSQCTSDGIAFEVLQPLGGNEYIEPRSYAVLVSAEVDRIVIPDDPPAPPELYLWFSSPIGSAAQGPVQLVSQSAEPLFEAIDGMSVYRLLLDNASSRTVNRLFLVERYRIRTDVERLTLSLDMPPELLEEFGEADELSPAEAPEVQAIVRRLIAPGAHPFEVGRRLYDHVVGSYEPVATERSQSVVELLNDGRGNAQALSALFVALSRAAGLPARIQAGVLILPGGGNASAADASGGDGNATEDENVAANETTGAESAAEEGTTAERGPENDRAVRHFWAEFYVPAIGWVPVDPALGAGLYAEELPEAVRLESYFGNIDARRVAFSSGIAAPRPIHPDGIRRRAAEHYSLQPFHEELVGNIDSHRTRWYDIEIIGEYPP